MMGMAMGLAVAASAPAAADTYTISGAVTLPAGVDEAWRDQIYVSIQGDTTFTVKANAANGAFSFAGLDNGTYTLKAYAYPPGGTGEGPNLVTEYYGGTYNWDDRSPIVIDGASATGKNIDLDYGAILRGTLYPVAPLTAADMQGAQVTATGPYGVQYRATGDGTTGAYAIVGMIPGSYTLRMDATSYNGSGGGAVYPNIASVFDGAYLDEPASYGFAATSGSVSFTRNLVAYPSFTVSGTVELASGVDPGLLAGAKVKLTSEYYSTAPSATVNPSTGAWSIAGLPRVSYYGATVGGPGLVPQTYATSLSSPSGDMDLGAVTLAAGQPISGHVSLTGVADPQQVLANTRITLSSTGYTASNVRVDPATGNWSSDPVPPGSYTVLFFDKYHEAFVREYYNDAYEVADATPVVVNGSGPVTGIDVVLSATRHFTTTPTPTFTGVKGLANTLTAAVGTWKATPDAFTYQWYRNGTAISGATKKTYKLTSSDSTKKISVKVTATKADYPSVSKTSAQVTMPKFFAKAPKPTISGTARAGKTLTAKPGTWSPKPALSYQWYRDGVAISKATKSTYKVTAADKGKKITVKVTAKKSGYGTDSKTSAARSVYLEFSKPPTSYIIGTAKAGKTLTAVTGPWTPAATSFTYQWYRNGAKIPGATKYTYKVTSADKGKKLTVTITGHKSGYYPLGKTSAAKTVAK
jgi:hypothetical protein